MTPQASVIVPTHNKRERLVLMLEAFAHQAVPDFEVVVCDDGSTDGTAEALASLEAEVPYRLVYVSGPRGGAGAARNRAAAAARGDVLIFNDDDMVPAPGFVARHVEACAAGDVLSRGERWAVPVDVVPSFLGRRADAALYAEVWSSARMTVAEKWTLDALAASPDHHYRFLQTCTSNLALRRSSFEQVGGFDESFGTRWGAEDTEFGYRAQLAGVGIRLTTAAKNLHLEHSTDSGAKFTKGLENFRRLAEIHPESKGIKTLVKYVEMAVERGHAAELFDEQSFVDWTSPDILSFS
ncbi:glycosyltransferase family 2 protein [Sinomonas sp. P10A9]|uniref:Glycosyltransferase family 2 protein n=1 Tax=Sinomonas puerhi TaxID=3238584 RepID=A0AB39L7N8_9MICC